MPADLQKHLRVPEELFNVQTRTYARYHVTDPAAFYNNEDLWTVPRRSGRQPEPAERGLLRRDAYAGRGPDPEFLLLQPMVPSTRPNMIAWIAARMDAPNYGTVRVYRFPQNTSVLGPTQIEAKIDADPIIAAQTTLWNQSGSKVIRGNLIVMPIQDSLIYLQPVYLQSANSAFPEFQRIVVATSQRIVWGPTLTEALQLLLGGTGPGPGPTPAAEPVADPGSVRARPRPLRPDRARPRRPATWPAGSPTPTTTSSEAQTALRTGDFATYGDEMAKVQEALRQLDTLVPVSPAP